MHDKNFVYEQRLLGCDVFTQAWSRAIKLWSVLQPIMAQLGVSLVKSTMYGSKGKHKRDEPRLRSACLVVLKLGSEVRMRLCAYIFTKLVVIILVVKIGLFKVMRLQIFVVLHFQLYVFRAILLSQAQIPKFGYNRKVCIFAKRCRMRHKIQYHNCANASCVLRKVISYALRKNQKKMIKPDSF